jgi:hypothetical protein
MIFHIKDGRLVPLPKPESKLRSWKRSPRRHKRVRTIERELAELLDAALAREEWRESRRKEQAA